MFYSEALVPYRTKPVSMTLTQASTSTQDPFSVKALKSSHYPDPPTPQPPSIKCCSSSPALPRKPSLTKLQIAKCRLTTQLKHPRVCCVLGFVANPIGLSENCIVPVNLRPPRDVQLVFGFLFLLRVFKVFRVEVVGLGI